MPQVIIVGDPDIHAWFTAGEPDWDTQVPVPTVDDMWASLQDGSLSANSEYVIFDQRLFNAENPDEGGFAEAIATFAPEAMVMITSYGYEAQPVLLDAVERMRIQYGLEEAPVYFLNVFEETFDGGVEIESIIDQHRAWAQARLELRQNGTPETQSAPVVPVNDSDPFNDTVAPAPAQEVPAAFQKKGLILASTSSKGGSGKTTVALCTASMLYHASRLATERGERDAPLSVCIVDMDTRDGQIGFLLGKTSPSALNIYLSPDKSIETIQKNLVYDEKLGIYALLAPKRARTADFLTPEFYRDVIEKLSTIFDVVMLDTSVNYLDPLLGQIVLPIADAVLFVTNLSIGSVYGMTRWMDEVTAAIEDGGSGIDKDKIGIVINQSLPGVGVDQELLAQAASGATLLVAIPLDSQAVIAASNYNSLSEIVLRHENISPSYFSLARKIWRTSQLVSPMDAAPQKKNQPAAQTSGAMPVTKQRSRLFGRKGK